MDTLLDIDMSVHGWIALVIAVVGIVALHLWLMRLARRPWDIGAATGKKASEDDRDGHDRPGNNRPDGEPSQ